MKNHDEIVTADMRPYPRGYADEMHCQPERPEGFAGIRQSELFAIINGGGSLSPELQRVMFNYFPNTRAVMQKKLSEMPVC